jgi:hypothetical protein
VLSIWIPAARQRAEQTTRSDRAVVEKKVASPTVEFRRDGPPAISMRDAQRAFSGSLSDASPDLRSA